MAAQIFEKFDSVITFAETIRKRDVNDAFSGKILYSEEKEAPREKWYMTKGYDQADSFLLDGWDEGADMVNVADCLKVNAAGGVDYRNKKKLGVRGFMPCVPAYLSGSPKNMYQLKKAPIQSKVVRIGYNVSTGGNANGEQIVMNTRKLINAIAAIERGGLRCELWAVRSVYGEDKSSATVAVRVKSASQYLDVHTMVYPLVNPSMNRRHGFRWLETANGITRGLAHGYGLPVLSAEDVRKNCEAGGLHLDHVFTYSNLLRIKSAEMLAESFAK